MPLAATAALFYGGLSLLAFSAYGFDKRQARRNGRRIPEVRLHGLALLGGFAGAWLGRRVFRHKTQRTSFGVTIVLGFLLHAALWIAWLRLWEAV